MPHSSLLKILFSFFISYYMFSLSAAKHEARKKRYLVFPDGAGLSVVYCLTWGTYLATDLFTFGQTLGIGFELPTNSTVFSSKFSSPYYHRMERRDVYTKVEVLLDSRGFNGRACILRAICEAANRSELGSFFDTIMRTLFTFPLSEGKTDPAEEKKHEDFDKAQWRGWTNGSCDQFYSTCSLSILDLAFEKLDPFRKK